jgi:outer membrane receptor protein involved in Fe transport
MSALTPAAWGDAPNGAVARAAAGTTLRDRSGWSLGLTVSGTPQLDDESARLHPNTFVNAQVARRLSDRASLRFDIFNVFDRRSGEVDYLTTARAPTTPRFTDDYLVSPVDARGFRLRLRITF